MKNSVIKGLIIAALFCAVAFSACKQGEPQKKITVTGIPAAYNGKFAEIRLIYIDIAAADSNPAAISNGTATMPLIDRTNNSEPFTESDTFNVLLYISDSPGGKYSYNGIIEDKSIIDETTTIRFDEFQDISS